MKHLKTIVFALALIMMYPAVSFTQSVGMGIEGGLNLSNISSTPTFNTGSRTGFMVGGFIDIGVSRIVSIKPSVRYIKKGYTAQGQGISLNETYSYIEMPLLVKAGYPLKHIKPYIEVGPTLGIQLGANREFTFDNGNIQPIEQDSGPSYTAIDFGLYFGSGMEFSVAPTTDLFTSFGYSLGLTNIEKGNTTTKNGGFQISAGVKFGL
jgi:hypothetical protein